jgi:hypothetical protein
MRCVLATAALSIIVAASAARADDEPVVGHLAMRHHVVTFFSSTGGTLYTVRTREGRVLLSKATESQLAARLPWIHKQIRSLVAGSSSGHGDLIWAGQ